MNHEHASQIAHLLNTRNQLIRPYDSERVLESAMNYLYELSDANEVIACLEIKRVQWYQFEIDHLSVATTAEGKGWAKKLLGLAEARANSNRGRVLQCTIREDNVPSKSLFKGAGFSRVSEFYYPDTGNNVGVWQKVISRPIVK